MVAAAMAGVPATGLRAKLTNYGDAGFSVFLRKAFIKAMGYTGALPGVPGVNLSVLFGWSMANW
jgi:hypothetical protein